MQETGLKEQHLVIGGGGYAGWNLALALSEKGFMVKILDIQEPPNVSSMANITFLKGNVTDLEVVKSACHGTDCVYHLASYGMSGKEQLNKTLIEKVNIQGTENVIAACNSEGVPRLVYTSTYNVVFGGQEIINGNESLPYLALTKHVDNYSRTKAIAEMKVLNANNFPLKQSSGVLKTCALRLAGVYGPGEQRHLPRIVSYVRRGLFSFTIGSSTSLVDFLHIDNLVQAHILAAEGLTPQRKCIAAGEVYFISDGCPVNNFEFFRPLVESLGFSFPRLSLPLALVYFFALMTEVAHSIIGPVYNFQPLLTRAEVYKTGVTHYFSINKAKTELGYTPSVQNDMSSVVRWYRDHDKSNRDESSLKSLIIILLVTAGCIAAFLFQLGLL